MQSHVDLQTALRSKHAVANMTAECFLARVNLHMRVQSTLNCKALAAVIALVWPLARMRANMPNKITRLPEGFWTVLALIRIFFRFFFPRVFLNDQMPFDTSIKNILKSDENMCTHVHAIHAFSLGNCVHQYLLRYRRIRIYWDI